MGWLMRLLMRLLKRLQPSDAAFKQDSVLHAPEVDDATRAYQSEKLAALEAQIERMARLRQLGYDFDATTRQDSDANH